MDRPERPMRRGAPEPYYPNAERIANLSGQNYPNEEDVSGRRRRLMRVDLPDWSMGPGNSSSVLPSQVAVFPVLATPPQRLRPRLTAPRLLRPRRTSSRIQRFLLEEERNHENNRGGTGGGVGGVRRDDTNHEHDPHHLLVSQSQFQLYHVLPQQLHGAVEWNTGETVIDIDDDEESAAMIGGNRGSNGNENSGGGNTPAGSGTAPGAHFTEMDRPPPPSNNNNVLPSDEGTSPPQAEQQSLQHEERGVPPVESSSPGVGPSSPVPPNHDTPNSSGYTFTGRQIEKIVGAMLRLLECPVCLESISLPVRQCVLGHLLCTMCFSRLNACPSCRAPLSVTSNRALEQIVEVVPLPCSNRATGCREMVVAKDKHEHEMCCGFRQHGCPIHHGNCLWIGYTPELITHVTQLHPNRLLTNNHVVKVPLTMGPTQVWLLSEFEEIFRVTFVIDLTRRSLIGWVSCYGNTESRSKFGYQMCLKNEGEPLPELVFSDRVHAENEQVGTRGDSFCLRVLLAEEPSTSMSPANLSQRYLCINVKVFLL